MASPGRPRNRSAKKAPPSWSTLPGTESRERPIRIPHDLAPLLQPIDAVRPDPANPRTTRDGGVDHLVTLLETFGWTDPIVASPSGVIEAGHQRHHAALAVGATHVPVVRTWHQGVDVPRFNIAHNRSNERVAGWDEPALVQLLRSLHEEDQAADLGWEASDLERLLAAELAEPENPRGTAGEDGEDEPIPDPPQDPITKAGEIVTLGPHTLHCADCMDVMRALPDCSVDAIVTDPPYGLSPDGRARTWDEIEELRRQGKGPRAGFMGKDWDAGVPGVTWARECLRVLKPGGHLIAFSSTRTVHRLTCAVEDAGFEIRDQFEWLYWQGFPKSLDVSKAIDAAAGAEREVVGKHARPGSTRPRVAMGDGWQEAPDITAPATPDAKRWAGWGTALKPSVEPACFARKPLDAGLTVAQNVLKWGTGALNIDACRFERGDPAWPGPDDVAPSNHGESGSHATTASSYTLGARHPQTTDGQRLGRWPANIYHCPKPASSEREDGCEDLRQASAGELTGGRQEGSAGLKNPRAGAGRTSDGRGNHHPTVKPKKLFRHLLRLVTPPGGTALELFAGSGTTIVAAKGLDLKIIAAEREPAYCDIIRARAGHPPTRR